eukprot:8018542-Alexandrium_andersonii.AAC.1
MKPWTVWPSEAQEVSGAALADGLPAPLIPPSTVPERGSQWRERPPRHPTLTGLALLPPVGCVPLYRARRVPPRAPCSAGLRPRPCAASPLRARTCNQR